MREREGRADCFEHGLYTEPFCPQPAAPILAVTCRPHPHRKTCLSDEHCQCKRIQTASVRSEISWIDEQTAPIAHRVPLMTFPDSEAERAGEV